jgi:hypothetical protein
LTRADDGGAIGVTTFGTSPPRRSHFYVPHNDVVAAGATGIFAAPSPATPATVVGAATGSNGHVGDAAAERADAFIKQYWVVRGQQQQQQHTPVSDSPRRSGAIAALRTHMLVHAQDV